MGTYLKRMAELVVMTFVGGASASLLASGRLDRAAFAGAVTAGVAAVYGLIVKRAGDKDRPTVL